MKRVCLIPYLAAGIFVTMAAQPCHTLGAQSNSAPLANDNFTNSTVIPAEGGVYATDNTAATAEPNEPRHGGVGDGHSLWWRWTAAANGELIVNTSGSVYTTVTAIYRGETLSNLTLVSSARVY